MFERFRASHERRFNTLLRESIQHLDITLDQTPRISSVYEVTTPRDEMFYVVGYQFSDKDYTGKIYQQFLAINPETQEIVGFSVNAVDFTRKDNYLQSEGIIASHEEGRYYGYALEVVRQHFFQEVANQNDRIVTHRVRPYYFGQTPIWNHFYGNNGVFGYDKRRRKVYHPVHDSVPEEQISRKGYHVIITKEQHNPSTWSITRDDGVLNRSAGLNLHRRENLKDKLRVLAARRR